MRLANDDDMVKTFVGECARMPKDGGAAAGEYLAQLDAVAHGLVATRKQLPALPALSRGSGRTSCPPTSITS
jgi:hypothetical protein